ncbi:MAG: phosphatidylserine/phosphatidylglycerophosphate/cardiolipin synthase family protein [Clostridia bacterium]|nr:phosphatidylserine/phosphatidylglycerophosphate/cardiolipin synthase family protein [Clostridia bacterium]
MLYNNAMEELTLLVDGKNAFPEILRCIDGAKESVRINMFIWRDDIIGNRMGEAVLSAAERGVKVDISVDRYGVVLEKAEECKRSFFHKKRTLAERIKTRVLELFYPMPENPKRAKDEETPLYKAILSHPNITVEKDTFKADHSKFYIIDNEILFLGGINIEDKENGADRQGRVYQDYMAKIVGEAHVRAFLDKLERGADTDASLLFGINRKTPTRLFEMEDAYLDLIQGAERELRITMAYFSPLKKFVNAIVSAHKRGVAVILLVPENANFQNDLNRKTVRKIMKKTGNGVRVLFSRKMVHTKLVTSEKYISFGSTNITKKAFRQLNELNLFVRNEPTAFVNALLDSVTENDGYCREIADYKEIKYKKLKAWIEGFLV